VLFRMSRTGSNYTVLHTFDLKAQPDGTGVLGMLQAPDGNFYATTVAGDQLKPLPLWEFQGFRLQYHRRVPNFNLDAYPFP